MKTDTSSPPNFVPLNMDRRLRVCIRPGDQHWQSAPQAPIRRWPLEREAPESGQVTSLVEYLPEARFPQHTHPNGEEIYVLEGVFSDETGDYPAGSYLRSPAGSRHSPFSEEGCLIFVKLNQFAQKDAAQVRLRSWSRCQRAAQFHRGRDPVVQLFCRPGFGLAGWSGRTAGAVRQPAKC